MVVVKQRSGEVEYDRGLGREARTDGVLKERLAGECTAGGKMCKRLVKRRDVYNANKSRAEERGSKEKSRGPSVCSVRACAGMPPAASCPVRRSPGAEEEACGLGDTEGAVVTE